MFELVKDAVNIDGTGTDLCPREAKDRPRTMSLAGNYTANSEVVDGDSTSAISPISGNLPNHQLPRRPSIASSHTSISSSSRAFKKAIPLRRGLTSTSQEMLPPSSVIRRSQQSDWSLKWGSVSDLSLRFSKSSISSRGSLLSMYVLFRSTTCCSLLIFARENDPDAGDDTQPF